MLRFTVLIVFAALLPSVETVLTASGVVAAAPAWQGRAALADGTLVLPGCTRSGWAGFAVTADLSPHAERTPVLRVAVGQANASQRVELRLLDQDGHECAWSFTLPAAGQTADVAAADGASFTLPNRPDPRDGAINDLRRITAWRIAADAAVDVRVLAVLAVDPDPATLQARTALGDKRRKEQGWVATREKLSAQFLATFPELSTPTPAAPAGKRLVRALHVGNSLTFQALSAPFKQWSLLAYEQRVIDLMDARGIRYIPAWHISWGASLPSIWKHPFEPAVANAGPLGRVLEQQYFDVLTMQLWGADVAGDVAAASAMIAAAVARNPALRSFLVETWVRKEKTLEPDYRTQWERPWPETQRYGVPPIHCRAYARLVFQRLQEATAGLRQPVRLIPVGSVLAELDSRLRAGAIPGLTRIEDLYADDVHLSERGSYAVLETFYAVILGESPLGRPRTERFASVDDAYATLVQEVVWQVVTHTPESGVAAAR
jgi:hypothetical protein